MSNDNALLTNSQKRTVLLFACLVGFAFSANYTNPAPLRSPFDGLRVTPRF
ncbi:hypothetical protein [Mucilaginibacter sp. UYCu711]|uniref:hypothetical protein n=1 Tax=Mucilaginibacter sp. UYCu711 TaxID=3156339 RepID=UPI003D1F5379